MEKSWKSHGIVLSDSCGNPDTCSFQFDQYSCVARYLQTWADAFQQSPDLKEAARVYQDLKAKGIEFPMTSLDHMAPIHTPAKVGLYTYPS